MYSTISNALYFTPIAAMAMSPPFQFPFFHMLFLNTFCYNVILIDWFWQCVPHHTAPHSQKVSILWKSTLNSTLNSQLFVIPVARTRGNGKYIKNILSRSFYVMDNMFTWEYIRDEGVSAKFYFIEVTGEREFLSFNWYGSLLTQDIEPSRMIVSVIPKLFRNKPSLLNILVN